MYIQTIKRIKNGWIVNAGMVGDRDGETFFTTQELVKELENTKF